ncbi:hypothetical protein [Agrobacterium vitis]|uniref:hypothetical protein n=1 Tax=Agrobacterium vitis TaxID=373 RepID=UPI0012E81E71|nr:hypothetical protein [Agrobacterium vitis]MUZ66096.1 hypothetical protein [Agrobacterium vitis]
MVLLWFFSSMSSFLLAGYLESSACWPKPGSRLAEGLKGTLASRRRNQPPLQTPCNLEPRQWQVRIISPISVQPGGRSTQALLGFMLWETYGATDDPAAKFAERGEGKFGLLTLKN